MSAVDFAQWAVPDLEIELGGRTYMVPPPSVDAMPKILAAAVRGEVKLGLVKGEVPAEVQAILDSIEVGEHPALGDAFKAMIINGEHPVTIDRVAYYAVFYWARGKDYADTLARLLWLPRELGAAGTEDDASPKG